MQSYGFLQENATFVLTNLNAMIIHAPAKINIGLDILRRRADGYHDIETLMVPVNGLYDTLHIEPSKVEEFASEGIVIDCPSDNNLCVKAVRLMQQRFGIDSAKILLDKRIPFGAGLGGGSSDAASVIVALNNIYALGQSTEQLAGLASELGSDTSFFVWQRPMFCRGRGVETSPYDTPRLKGMWVVVIKPSFGISTPEAYSGVKPRTPVTGLSQRLEGAVGDWHESIVNDFESTLFARYPRLSEIKRMLYRCGAVYASLSGSGSALFGLFESRPRLSLCSDLFVFTDRL